MLSIIVPIYIPNYSTDRIPLFKAVLSKLPIGDPEVEVIIHEMGESPLVKEWLPGEYVYYFTRFSGVFDRAWAFNVIGKNFANGDMLCLLDADILVGDSWLPQIKQCKEYAIAFNETRYLSSRVTKKFLETGRIIEEYQADYDGGQSVKRVMIATPYTNWGVTTLIPKKLFVSLKGVPEDFKGTWGGEDCALYYKMTTLGGVLPETVGGVVYHLYHSPSTKVDTEILKKEPIMHSWTVEQWRTHNENVGDNWGRIDEY